MSKTRTTYAPEREWHRGVQASAGTHTGHTSHPVGLYGSITAAGRRLVSWLDRLNPVQRFALGLQRPEPAPYRPDNRARMAQRRTRRRMVQASRRANR